MDTMIVKLKRTRERTVPIKHLETLAYVGVVFEFAFDQDDVKATVPCGLASGA